MTNTPRPQIPWDQPVTLADLPDGDDGSAVMSKGRPDKFILKPLGECNYCDHKRANGFGGPAHDAMSGCRSGARPHCGWAGCF